MAHGESHGPTLPNAPASWTGDQARVWNETMRILSQFHNKVHAGCVGLDYTVSGTVPTTATLDLGSINVTAVALTLAKLLIDLKNHGILDVKNV